MRSGIDTAVIKGADPGLLYDLFDGELPGYAFCERWELAGLGILIVFVMLI